MWKRCTHLVLPVVILALVLGSVASGAFDPLGDATLIGWWKCDEGAGSVVADSSPNKRDGTFVNGSPAWTTGVSGSAVRLVGPTLVEIPAPNVRLTQATMAGWFLPTGVQSDWASMIMHRGTGQAHGFNFLADRHLAYHWNDDAATWSYRGNAYYAADEWTHCAVTVEPTKATFYVNGIEASVNTVAHAESNWNNPIHLGGDDPAAWAGRQMNGALDDVVFFSRVLTAAEIKSLVPPKLKAMKPIPADGAIGATTPLLQWTKGDTAMFHNVYLGTTADLTEANLVATRQPFNMYFHIPGFQPGTTYYWRVDEVESNMTTVHTGNVWKFTTEPLKANVPSPADVAANVFPAPTLSWLPGKGAIEHQVFLSSSLDDVVNGATAADKGKTAATKLSAGALRSSTTYYWRVDEIKGDGKVETGDIWSFSTADGVSKKIVRQWWSGFGGTAVSDLTNNANYPNTPTGTELVDQFEGPTDWADNYGSKLYGWLTVPQSGDYTFWIASDDGSQLWLSTDADPGKAAQIASVASWVNSRDFDNTGGTAGGATQKSAVIKLQAGQKYFIQALMKEGGGGDNLAVAWQGPGIAARQVIPAEFVDTFALPPLQAFSPSPAHGAVDAPQDGALSWSAGEKAQKHDVYLGEDAAAVAAADTSSPLFKGSQTGTTFNAGDLAWNKTYYWRVDEVNPAEAGSPWKGPVWSFTTAGFVPIDDFESYNDDLEAKTTIFDTWIDGFTNNLSGSTVGNAQAPFAEQTIVHSGKQAMPMDYDNTKTPFYSEAEKEFAQLQDWTASGVTDLSLWVRGYPAVASVPITETAGKMSVTGAGADIWGNSDQFTFAFKTLNGDGSIVARVVSNGTGSNTWAKGGVMVRDSLDGGSTFANMVITGGGGNGASFQYRLATNGGCGNSDSISAITPPYWVRIERSGSDLTGYLSTDGKVWRIQGTSQTIEMGAPVYIGLCVTSHASGEDRTFEFDSITTTGDVSGAWQGAVITAQRHNSAAGLYVTVEDSTGKAATVSDPALANAANWTEWKIPLSSFTGVNLARVKKMVIGVGDKAKPVAGGTGRIFVDDIRVVTP